jgi:NAD+ synthase
MTDNLTIAVAQLNYTVGDLAGNKAKILKAREEAAAGGADLVLFSEMCITGYPAEDLVLLETFQQRTEEILQELAKATADDGPAMLIGSLGEGIKRPRNSVYLLGGGHVVHRQDKHDLPNYGVFDEQRVFESGGMPTVWEFKGVKLGILICEDMWNMKVAHALKGADIILSINGSPFEVGKHQQRLDRAHTTIKELNRPLVYVNQICGQDDLVFDGDSFVLSDTGEVRHRLSRTAEEVRFTFWKHDGYVWQCEKGDTPEYSSEAEMIYQAMILSLRDYVNKNKFPGVVIGMSGGVDSALTAAVAVDALGADRVRLVMMPSQYTSDESLNDAQECADNLGVKLENIHIKPMYDAYVSALAPVFDGAAEDLTEENLQSRIRGMLLMAISNKTGNMVLSTGNKSEVSVGYATLYGDMCGGYNVLKDVYKQQVFEVCNWRNQHLPEGALGGTGERIPQNIITKAPTAELRDNQKDSDSLPEYDVLDPILIGLIEDGHSVDDMVIRGHDRELVERVSGLLIMAEYKRRQSAPGVKVSRKPFSRDRRYPITNKFKG